MAQDRTEDRTRFLRRWTNNYSKIGEFFDFSASKKQSSIFDLPSRNKEEHPTPLRLDREERMNLILLRLRTPLSTLAESYENTRLDGDFQHNSRLRIWKMRDSTVSGSKIKDGVCD